MKLEIISRHRGESQHRTPLLFIHGMMHGAWCFALDLPKPTKVKSPLLILGVARDNMLKPSEIDATVRAYHTQSEIIPDVAHNSMLEPRWQTVAERIRLWLNERKV